jgi:hypothetical protein
MSESSEDKTTIDEWRRYYLRANARLRRKCRTEVAKVYAERIASAACAAEADAIVRALSESGSDLHKIYKLCDRARRYVKASK